MEGRKGPWREEPPKLVEPEAHINLHPALVIDQYAYECMGL
jgi:hypothetical protein